MSMNLNKRPAVSTHRFDPSFHPLGSLPLWHGFFFLDSKRVKKFVSLFSGHLEDKVRTLGNDGDEALEICYTNFFSSKKHNLLV